jgi:hypothetical protein
MPAISTSVSIPGNRAHGALLQVVQLGVSRIGAFHSFQCDRNPPQNSPNVAPLCLTKSMTGRHERTKPKTTDCRG